MPALNTHGDQYLTSNDIREKLGMQEQNGITLALSLELVYMILMLFAYT